MYLRQNFIFIEKKITEVLFEFEKSHCNPIVRWMLQNLKYMYARMRSISIASVSRLKGIISSCQSTIGKVQRGGLA